MIKSIEGKFVFKDSTEKKRIYFDCQSGMIDRVENFIASKEPATYTYSDNCLIFPGFIDIHVHAREDTTHKLDYKEDFLSCSKAALNGGVTVICDMPNNPIPPKDDSTYLSKRKLTKSSIVPILLYSAITDDSLPLKIEVPYKIFLTHSVGNMGMSSNESIEKRLALYDSKFVSFHCEDGEIIKRSQNGESHLLRRPPTSEVKSIEYALKLIERYNLKGIICHCSTKEGLKKILQAKDKGVDVQVEVAPHHLYFCDEDLFDQQRKILQSNPPIRSIVDRDYLIEKVKEGRVDFLATDHAPHTFTEKTDEVSGITGLDTYSKIVCWLMNEKGVSENVIFRMCSSNPARFLNNFLQQFEESFVLNFFGFGKIKKGYAASFTVVDRTLKSTLHEIDLSTKNKFSPYVGESFSGDKLDVFSLGKIYNVKSKTKTE